MSKCDVCGTKQEKIGESTISICGQELNVAHYNINLTTHVQGKWVCDDCMDIYYTIHAMIAGVDFSCGGKEYYADGRNLDEYRTNFTGGANEHQICEETQRTNKIRWNGY